MTTDGTWTYTYTDRGELNTADHNSGTTNDLDYDYDAIGNRDDVTKDGNNTNYVAANANHYTTVGSTSPVHDGDGNLTQPPPTRPSDQAGPAAFEKRIPSS